MKSFDRYKEIVNRGVEEVFGTEIPPGESIWKNIEQIRIFLNLQKNALHALCILQKKYRQIDMLE